MSSVNNISALREAKGWKRPQLAKLMRTTPQQIERLEKGQRELTTSWIDRASDAFGVQPWQIITPIGEGPQLPEGRVSPPANDHDVVDIIALDLALSMGPGTLIEEFVESEPVKMSLRLVQSITRTPSDRLRLVRGIGDSMEPTLRTEDRVMIDLNERSLARIGGIYWIDHLGTHGLKRLRAAGPGRIRIMSDNPAEENFDVDAADVRIQGRAIWFARGL